MCNLRLSSFIAVIFFCFSAATLSYEIESTSYNSEAHNSHNFDLGLRVNLDANRFDGIYRQYHADNYLYDSQLRRARVSLKFPLGINWSSKIQYAVNEDDQTYKAKDLYLRYTGSNFFDLKIGQSKEPFGLEYVTSSSNLSFTERSLSSLALGRSKGVNFSNLNSRYSWSFGAYKVEENGNVKADGDKAYTARVTFSPLNTNNKYNHFGLAYSTRDLKGAEYEIKTNGGVDSASNFLDTKNILTDTIVKRGAEAAWGSGQISLQGEYHHLEIDALNEHQNATYQAYYSQISYFVTNDHRTYSKGRLSSVRPNSKTGALELVLRKSALQSVEIGANNKNTPIDIENTVIGVNYYLSNKIKLMLNATDTKTNIISKLNKNQNGSALSLRLQIVL